MNSASASCQCQSNRASLETIAQFFKAFADPTRLQLICALQKETKNVGELVKELDQSQANVSKHLQTLYDAKILSREKRGTATYYAIADEVVFELCDLVCAKINKDYKERPKIEFQSETLVP